MTITCRRLFVVSAFSKTKPSVSSIARGLIDKYGLPHEQHCSISELYRTFTQNNLSPAYFICSCSECENKSDDQFLAYDISHCYWNILTSFDELPISSAFDSVHHYNNEAIDCDTFYIIQGFKCNVIKFNYNNQWLSGELVEQLDAENYVKFYYKPSGMVRTNIFRLIDKLYHRSTWTDDVFN